MALPKIAAEEFNSYYLANNRSSKTMKMLYIVSGITFVLLFIGLILSVLEGESSDTPTEVGASDGLRLFGFRLIEIMLIYLCLSSLIIFKINEIMNFIWRDKRIREKMSNDITFRQGKNGPEITLTKAIDKYTYICDDYLKIKLHILLVISMIGMQLFGISFNIDIVFRILITLPSIFLFYNLYLLKKSGTAGMFVFHKKILPLIDQDN